MDKKTEAKFNRLNPGQKTLIMAVYRRIRLHGLEAAEDYLQEAVTHKSKELW